MADIILTEKDIEKFWAKTKPNPARTFNGVACLEWTSRRTKSQYVQLSRGQYAHRAAWIIAHGPIPAGLCVLHHCDNPPCVNVVGGHLFAGTKRDNTHDMLAKGRARGARPKTHCPKGHPYSGENLYLHPRRDGSNPAKACRTCKPATLRAWREKRK